VARIAVARTISWWHTSQFLIAEVEGTPTAALCSLPAGGTGASARAAIEEVAGDMGLDACELSAILRRGAYTRSCWIQGGDGDWLIEHVASRPSHRGRGLVQALITTRLLPEGRPVTRGRRSRFTSATRQPSDAIPRQGSRLPKRSGIRNLKPSPARRAFAGSSGRFEASRCRFPRRVEERVTRRCFAFAAL
jgi:hypothetical protein